ncbi:MAG: M23 family metallopeptidase, partial [Thermoanaerobaculia bacterium]
MIAVLDHERKAGAVGFYCSQIDEVVGTYTGEVGRVKESGTGIIVGSCTTPAYRYHNSAGLPFVVNGKYRTYQSDRLAYDGHAGYDFQGISPASTSIIAAASGEVFIPALDSLNGRNGTATPYCGYHTFKIRHSAPGGTWETWYLHSQSLVGRFADILSMHTTNSFCTVGSLPTDLSLGYVEAGEAIAIVGQQGANDPHLHFELRRDGKIIDPYGWEWLPGTDPFASNMSLAAPQVEPLWRNVLVPKVTNISLAPISGGYQASVTGQNFDTSKHVYLTLWDIRQKVLVGKTSLLTSHTTTSVVASLPPLPVGRPVEDFALKVENNSGPRSIAVPLSLAVGFQAVPLLLNGGPAPGGGTLWSFGGFDAFNNQGDLYFGASVETTGDDIGDEDRKLLRTDGQTTLATFPNISKVGAVRLNESGGVAYSDASSSGGQAIYVRAAPGVAPIKIIQHNQAGPPAAPINGLPLWDISGPRALSESGDVTFHACTYDPGADFVRCGYIMLYDKAAGTLRVVAGDEVSSPIGGAFDMGVGAPNEFTGNGDVLFWSV